MQHCTRCNCHITKESGLVRSICSTCDLELQEMHWNLEHGLYRRVIYILPGEEPSLDWLRDSKHAVAMFKPYRPVRRDFFVVPSIPVRSG